MVLPSSGKKTHILLGCINHFNGSWLQVRKVLVITRGASWGCSWLNLGTFLPSGNLSHSYWAWPLIYRGFPKNGGSFRFTISLPLLKSEKIHIFKRVIFTMVFFGMFTRGISASALGSLAVGPIFLFEPRFVAADQDNDHQLSEEDRHRHRIRVAGVTMDTMGWWEENQPLWQFVCQVVQAFRCACIFFHMLFYDFEMIVWCSIIVKGIWM